VIVLETSALVAIVVKEPAGATFLERVLAPGEVLLPAHCLLEAHIVLGGRYGPEMLRTLDNVVARAELRIHAFTPAHAAEARTGFLRFGKGRHPAALTFGDCMSYGTARAEGLPLLWADAGFALTDAVAA
jgi:ribonuclease VapC